MIVQESSNVSRMRGGDEPSSRTTGVGDSRAIRPQKGFWNRCLRHRSALTGLLITGALVLIAVLAPWLAPYDPIKIDLPARLGDPSTEHFFGLDQYGRDILSRVIWGSRISLAIGLVSVSIATVVGGLLGGVGGYLGGHVENAIMRGCDVLLAFPGVLLALGVVAVLGPGLINVMVAIGIGMMPRVARVMRSCVLEEKTKDYCLAAKAIGGRGMWILLKHILPNALGPLIVMASLSMPGAILGASGLSFLGLGAQPPTSEWGAMLADSRNFLMIAPHIGIFPGLAISLAVMGLNLLGDGVRDILDPRLTQR